MKKNDDSSNKGTVEVDGAFATITFHRLIPHSPQRIWEAIKIGRAVV